VPFLGDHDEILQMSKLHGGHLSYLLKDIEIDTSNILDSSLDRKILRQPMVC
jgi:hypothetical protein